jgi:hypothetical protein
LNPGTLESSNPALLSKKIYVTFNAGESSTRLSAHCLDLLSEQKEAWQKLKDAYDALKTVRTRSLILDGFSVCLYYNPGRMTSATAAVGQKDVKDRPCFLCLNNLPSEQRWILYRNEYRILCNPMPAFPSHFTIAHVEHQPQAISKSFDSFLILMADLGDGWITLYNGPRCGASAPDHLHLQAVPAGHMPVEQAILEATRFLLVAQIKDVFVYRINDMGREILVLKGDNRVSMAHAFIKVLTTLEKVIPTKDEPMVNIAGFHDGGSWHVALFPRRKHRPDAYFREGDERIVVSPGVVEMAGVLVTPMERDFNRLDAAVVESIYREVSVDGNMLAEVIKDMA